MQYINEIKIDNRIYAYIQTLQNIGCYMIELIFSKKANKLQPLTCKEISEENPGIVTFDFTE